MRKLVYLVVVAALAVPAFSVAATTGPADKAAATNQCTTERGGMGVSAFKLLYGTNATKSNAFGKCVSKLATQNAKNTANASASCRTERTADPGAFPAKYGAGKKHANAFGNCVSQTAKAAAQEQQQATTNANKSNAFGKCVSGKVRHAP